MSESRVRVRFLFADSGAFHHEDLEVPGDSLKGYERIIDAFLEDPQLLKGVYLDLDRLCSAWLVDSND